jgi:hypothetical protein
MTSNDIMLVEQPGCQPGKGNLDTQIMSKPKNTSRKIYFQYALIVVRDDLRLLFGH